MRDVTQKDGRTWEEEELMEDRDGEAELLDNPCKNGNTKPKKIYLRSI
jgi:hypothetical protein